MTSDAIKAIKNWAPAKDRPDPVELLREQERDRVPELLPIRHERMLESPFGFFRGAAAIMAADLASIATSGLHVQLCGDAHLLNFGGFATPERRLIFDVNDFDETLPGPWEWDVLRLAASIEVAGQGLDLKGSRREEAIGATVRAYCNAMRQFARMSPLDVWYSRVNVKRIVELWKNAKMSNPEHLPPRLVRRKGGALSFRDNPPLMQRLSEKDERAIRARSLLKHYQTTLPPHVRVLAGRYQLVDMALKVVGVGSVGLRCYVALFTAPGRFPLLLQVKEADDSVLERYLGPSEYSNSGERVVNGQRLMQAASDIFLGWLRDEAARDSYVRQLHDMKASVDLTLLRAPEFADYAVHCGQTLARAHARSGDPAAIASYLGGGSQFERAIINFARAYANQNERDYERYKNSSEKLG